MSSVRDMFNSAVSAVCVVVLVPRDPGCIYLHGTVCFCVCALDVLAVLAQLLRVGTAVF